MKRNLKTKTIKKTKELDLTLLRDGPVLKSAPNYYEFYHDYISPALERLIRKDSVVHTIGLFGRWGSGKSTVIDNLKQDYEDYPVFVFDAWKYQEDPLRRTFLVKLFDFINEDNRVSWKKDKLGKPVINNDFLEDLYVTTGISKDEEQSEKSDELGFFRKIWNSMSKNPLPYILLGVLAVSLSIWLTAQYKLGESNQIVMFLLQFVGIIGLSTTATAFVSIVGKELATNLVKWVLDDLKGKIHSQTIIKTRESLNSPEQFEKKFKTILESIDKNIVIVFDNIDRVQADTAIQTLSTIKTFFDPSDRSGAIFIIPCDSEAILSRIDKYYLSDKKVKSDEYLRKLFNVVIWAPDFISTDLEDFAKKTIGLMGKDAKILLDEKLFLVMNQLFLSNPREVKQFLNNLVAALLVADKTEVREIIFANIPYLAKVLVIREKFPYAYDRIKNTFWDSENIIKEKDKEDFKNFMLDTSIVTTSNAEPFIYYKMPNQTKKVVRSNELSGALISGNYELSKDILMLNKNKTDDLADFIVSLYKTYKSNPDWLSKFIETLLTVMKDTSLNIIKPSFYNKTAEAIYRYVWQKYYDLPTDIIFDKIIKNSITEKKLRVNLIERYVSVLAADDIKSNKGLLVQIVRNLINTNLDEEWIQKIRNTIENNYSTDFSVIQLINKIDIQQQYLSNKSFNSLLTSINNENYPEFVEIVANLKDFIIKNNFSGIVIRKFNDILAVERGTTPTDDRKKQLFGLFESLFFGKENLLDNVDNIGLTDFCKEIINTYANSGQIEDKYYIIPTLYILLEKVEQPYIDQINHYINQYIQVVSVQSILTNIITTFDKYDLTISFLSKFIAPVIEKSITTDRMEFQPLYEVMDTKDKLTLLVSLIDRRPDAGLSFIESLPNLPDREEVLKKMLDRASKLNPQDRIGIYNWVNKNLKTTDDVSLKNAVVLQVKDLLKNDHQPFQEIGMKLLEDASYLSKMNKIDIAVDLIEWFKTAGKVITSNNRPSIKSVAHLYRLLGKERRNEYINQLFKMLEKQDDRQNLEVSLESLLEVDTTYIEYRDQYNLLLEQLGTWNNIENKKFVINEIVKLKPKKLKRDEKSFWSSLELMINQT